MTKKYTGKDYGLSDEPATVYSEAAVMEARLERDAYIGKLLAMAMEEAKRVHQKMGLPADVKVVFDESGVFTEGSDGVRHPIEQAARMYGDTHRFGGETRPDVDRRG